MNLAPDSPQRPPLPSHPVSATDAEDAAQAAPGPVPPHPDFGSPGSAPRSPLAKLSKPQTQSMLWSVLLGLAVVGTVSQLGRERDITLTGRPRGPARVKEEPQDGKRPQEDGPERPDDPQGRSRDTDESRATALSQEGRGRHAEGPTEIPARGWKDILLRVYGEIDDDRILAVAAGVTFYGLLAIFPAIGAFVALYGLVADTATINEQMAVMSGFLPGGALEIIGDQVKRINEHADATLGFAFFSGLAISLWSANAGMKAMFDALNIAYEEKEKRGFFSLNLWSLGFTLSAILFVIVAMAGVVAVPVVLKFIGLGGVLGNAAQWILWIARWPALFLVIVLALALLYRYGPSRERAQWRWLTPGSAIAAALWLIASMLFSWYVSSFGNYNATYGSLGAAIGFMTWIWISSIIVLAGAELNAEIEHQTARDTTDGPPAPLGARGARMADSIGRAHGSAHGSA